jgi:hypothetical protein
VLANVFQHSVVDAAQQHPEGHAYSILSVHHPIIIVLSQDCDLETDYYSRYPEEALEGRKPNVNVGVPERYHLGMVMACSALEDQALIKLHNLNSGSFKRIQENRDRRYYSLPAFEEPALPHITIDFKHVLGLNPAALYSAVRAGSARRVAVLKLPYVYDVMQRFASFLSRAALPGE